MYKPKLKIRKNDITLEGDQEDSKEPSKLEKKIRHFYFPPSINKVYINIYVNRWRDTVVQEWALFGLKMNLTISASF